MGLVAMLAVQGSSVAMANRQISSNRVQTVSEALQKASAIC
jgi:hypothetical protein